MCGIVGYVGKRNAVEVIVSGLEKLEYRGYDSAGIAVFETGKLTVTRAVGKLAELKKTLGINLQTSTAHVGIGHTRWATHGKPSEANAHPHTAGRISIIHNGIIENYAELKAELTRRGRIFRSDTDTEIVAHLCDEQVQNGAQPFAALTAACKQITGSYAFLMVDAEHPDRILFAKQHSPMILGVGEGEFWLASDIPAILSSTSSVVILEDGDSGEISTQGFQIWHGGKNIVRPVTKVSWDPITAQKGGYKHFMLKEIHDQQRVIADTFRGRISLESGTVTLDDVLFPAPFLKSIERMVLVACGTAWHASLVAKFFIERFARIPVEVDYASEFRYRSPVLSKKTLVMAVSQSGETSDTLAAVDLAGKESELAAICNVLGSALARRVPRTLFTNAGPEISVASTKAFTTQIVASYLFALRLGAVRGTLSRERESEAVKALSHLPRLIEETMLIEDQVKEVARKFQHARDYLFLGRGVYYPIALEGALKLKEISYVHAEGYPAGEMKHGPIALIDEKVPVVAVLPRGEPSYGKTLSNLREVQARDGRLCVITDTEDLTEIKRFSEFVIKVPYLSEELGTVLMTLPLQFLAYYVAVLNGTDVDLPRNLAKSVTVE